MTSVPENFGLPLGICDDRYGSFATFVRCWHVRFAPKSDHGADVPKSTLCADIVEKSVFPTDLIFAEAPVHLSENYLGDLIFDSLFNEQLS